MSGRSSHTPYALPMSLACIALGVGWWQARVMHVHQSEVRTDSAQGAKQEYPIPEEIKEPPAVSAAVAETLVRANPFSSQRHLIPPPVDTGGSGGPEGSAKDRRARFLYKGHITIGTRLRAIVEDTTSSKTHFLEVGQEVTGFKVLDITENRVILSDLQTDEEVTVSLTPTTSP